MPNKQKNMVSSIKSLEPSNSIEEDIRSLFDQGKNKYADTFVHLAGARCLFISEDFTKQMAAEVAAWLIYYNCQSKKEPIFLYINSNGGDGAALTHIYDTMQMISAPINTICTGKCYSAAAFILAAGSKGKRFIYSHGEVMVHGIQCNLLPDDQANSKTYYDFLNNYNDSILQILVKHAKHPLEKIKEDCKRDLYFDAEEAVNYGLCDYIIV